MCNVRILHYTLRGTAIFKTAYIFVFFTPEPTHLGQFLGTKDQKEKKEKWLNTQMDSLVNLLSVENVTKFTNLLAQQLSVWVSHIQIK